MAHGAGGCRHAEADPTASARRLAAAASCDRPKRLRRQHSRHRLLAATGTRGCRQRVEAQAVGLGGGSAPCLGRPAAVTQRGRPGSGFCPRPRARHLL